MPSWNAEFYPPEVTERSRLVLQRLHEAIPDAVLIGGWGTWVRTGGPTSHDDIDLILTRCQLAAISRIVDDVSESRHVTGRRWRATLDGIYLDLYVPHQSVLGQHFELRTEVLVRRTEVVDGWPVLEPPCHLATKLAALVDRPDSVPGDKDRHEVMALLTLGIDGADAASVMHEASARAPGHVTQLIALAFDYLGDLPLDRHERFALNQYARDWHTHSFRLSDVSSSRHDPRSTGRRRTVGGLPGVDR